MTDQVILVDEHDNQVGTCEKIEAHEKGLLHRALSVFMFNSKGELLIQQRDEEKYHSPCLWSNTACSHPYPGENNLAAAQRRLKEEMGLEAKLTWAFSFLYKCEFENGLSEHEFDHVYVGFTNALPNPDPKEVMAWEWASANELEERLKVNELEFTPWFKLCYKQAFDLSLKRSAHFIYS